MAEKGERVVWVGERSVEYSPLCPTKDLEPLNELLCTLYKDISDCEGLDLLESVESVESGCRAY